MKDGYRNIGYVLLILPLVIAAGFWIPYLSHIPRFDASVTTAVHFHALLLFTWTALLIVQPLAIRAGAFSIHRAIGKSSYVLMPLIAVSAIAMLRKEYQQHLADGMSAIAALAAEYLSTVQIVLFTAFYIAAVVRIQRRDIAGHLRYMICIALVLLPAGFARTLCYWFNINQATAQAACLVLIDLCLIGLVVFEHRRHSVARPYMLALAAYIVAELAWIALDRPV
jgi:hypothetical protein